MSEPELGPIVRFREPASACDCEGCGYQLGAWKAIVCVDKPALFAALARAKDGFRKLRRLAREGKATFDVEEKEVLMAGSEFKECALVEIADDEGGDANCPLRRTRPPRA